MAKVELQIPKELGLTAKELELLKKKFKRELVETIKASRARQTGVEIRAKSIVEQTISGQKE